MDWSSTNDPVVNTVVVFPDQTPLTCFLVFDRQTHNTPAFRNEMLSTDSWPWYGNVTLVPLIGNWPNGYVPRRHLIRHALQYYSTNHS